MQFFKIKVACVVVISALIGVSIGQAFAGRFNKKNAIPGSRQNPIVMTFGRDLTIPEREAGVRRNQYLNNYQGTKLVPNPNIVAKDSEIHKQITLAFEKLDPAPEYRRQRFDWLTKLDPDLRFLGWNGQILDVSQTPDGVNVKLIVYPHIASEKAALVTTSDHTIETFHFSRNDVTFIEYAEDAKNSRSIFYD